jgi:hypothetical protein
MFLLRVIQALDKNRIRYVLVGGYAVALHGVVRGTVDVDLAIRLSKSGFRKVEKTLNDLGLKSRLPVSADDVFNFREEYIMNRNLKAWSFVNPDKPGEIVDILITEDASNLKTVTKTITSQKVRVADIPELIRMKTGTGRPQDEVDIKALKELL